MDWSTEVQRITRTAARYFVDPAFIAAIRKAENGAPGREFGILSEQAPSYQRQLNVCCATVRNNLVRYGNDKNPLTKRMGASRVGRIMYSDNFIKFLGSKYCPVGAENDPTGLNANWIINVTNWYTKMVLRGM